MVISFLPRSTKKKLNAKVFTSFEKETIFFEYARQAMKIGLEMFDFKKDQEVLMPASLCPAVLEPFINLGLKVKLYNLDKLLNWTLTDIESKITHNTKAIYVIHYFGIKFSLTELRDLCDEKGIILIEDCALSGLSDLSDIETVGDFSIYSIWKFHAIPDGAILRLNKKLSSTNKLYLKSPNKIKFAKRLGKIIIKNLIIKWSLPLNFFRLLLNKNSLIQDDPPNDNYGDYYPIFDMSRYARNIFLKEDLELCAKRRRLNFNSLHDFCLENDIPALFGKVSQDSIPYCFPILVDDPLKLQNKMLRDGIETELSINVPFKGKKYLIEVDDDFLDISYLAKHTLSIPIHQNIGANENKYLKDSLLKNLKGDN